MARPAAPAVLPRYQALRPTTRRRWRAWLQRHHDSKDGVWLLFYKQHTGKPALAYQDALDEALCFGWIDGQVRRVDDETYALKFTPRRPGSVWSEVNQRRAKQLIDAGLMTPAGLAAFRDPARRGYASTPRDAPLEPPPDFAAALAKNKRAQGNFQAFAPGYRRGYVFWVTSAKRPETRARRIRDAVARIARNEKTLLA